MVNEAEASVRHMDLRHLGPALDDASLLHHDGMMATPTGYTELKNTTGDPSLHRDPTRIIPVYRYTGHPIRVTPVDRGTGPPQKFVNFRTFLARNIQGVWADLRAWTAPQWQWLSSEIVSSFPAP